MDSIQETAAAAEAVRSPMQRLLLGISVSLSCALLAFFGWLAWIALAAR